jgi:site-specific recombinase XerC
MLRAYEVFLSKKGEQKLNMLFTILLGTGYDIRTIHELLGHQNLQTTMIYTHVAKKNVLGVRSPPNK